MRRRRTVAVLVCVRLLGIAAYQVSNRKSEGKFTLMNYKSNDVQIVVTKRFRHCGEADGYRNG